jgi:hypothetical protein
MALMMACVSPVTFNYDSTLETLRFAEKAKLVKNHPKINFVSTIHDACLCRMNLILIKR